MTIHELMQAVAARIASEFPRIVVERPAVAPISRQPNCIVIRQAGGELHAEWCVSGDGTSFGCAIDTNEPALGFLGESVDDVFARLCEERYFDCVDMSR